MDALSKTDIAAIPIAALLEVSKILLEEHFLFCKL